MRLHHGIGKPKEHHFKCNTKGCPNYFNINYKDSNGYCKPCNTKRKRRK